MKTLLTLLIFTTSFIGFSQDYSTSGSYLLQNTDNVSFELSYNPVVREGKQFYSCKLTVVNNNNIAMKRRSVNDDRWVSLELSKQNKTTNNWTSKTINFIFKNPTEELEAGQTIILYELYECSVPPVLLNKKFNVGYVAL